MGIKVKITCDFCGAEEDSGTPEWHTLILKKRNMPLGGEPFSHEYDLCPQCYVDVNEWIVEIQAKSDDNKESKCL